MFGEGCSFKGRVFLQGEARIGGQIEGILISDGFLTLEETARVIGNLSGVKVQLNGTVEGNVTASGILRISASARIKGDLTARRLVVEEGAKIDGRVSIVEDIETREEPEPSLLPSLLQAG